LTASNYAELKQLYEKYSRKGFEVLAFPCNQFGAQEPGTNAEIQAFAKSQGAKFPVFGKIEVNGDGAAPVYKWLKDELKEGGLLGFMGNDLKWNFSKFLVGPDGKPVKRYAPTDSPLSIEPDIVKLVK